MSNSCNGIHIRYEQKIRTYEHNVFCSVCNIFVSKDDLWKKGFCPCCHVRCRLRTRQVSRRKDLKRVGSFVLVPKKSIHKIRINKNE